MRSGFLFHQQPQAQHRQLFSTENAHASKPHTKCMSDITS